mmetsp:Transcript_134907/g.200705  ORF Transcript_134907/g.200705 Transcript_134907/m.200705 type:complete len:125 (+) Transcript_134907:758-1132(+)|eukprot:CAMPEP_0117024536 /NCGR_PEP_ID=MMETSP0472-20121206/18210_1 /TAXON_ID=693140 ORGANISM="Tiarina fusus, Strain LIS" /NCGR_SAMPLE_ID=MMETSP0472 /ASSEMBLY_ACC=CAM_ASM_000603 /LENGTH=124 /DNA_ID=CAMNT_0004730991 /DNA_START=758 /DNA_END=1132 /DNA_ORIENTATION=+
MAALVNVGPLGIAVDAAWFSYESGVFSGCSTDENVDIDHGVSLVGYGTDAESGKNYWLVRNSWGSSWGENGYIRLERESDLENGIKCGTDSTPKDGVACKGETDPVKVCGTCGIYFDVSYPTGA